MYYKNITLHFAKTYNNHWYIASNDIVFYVPELFSAMIEDPVAVESWCVENDVSYKDLRARLTSRDKVYYVGETKKLNPKSNKLVDEMRKSFKSRKATDEVKKLFSKAHKISCESDYENICYLSIELFGKQTPEEPMPVTTPETLDKKKLEAELRIAKMEYQLQYA